MVITLSPELEAAIAQLARRRGTTVESLALGALRERFLTPSGTTDTPDEWEELLRSAATDCGVSLPHSALSSEGLYE